MFFVYIYYINDIIVYIGKATKNPYLRYCSHIRKESTWLTGNFLGVNKIGLFQFNTKTEMEIAEHCLLVRHKPIWNHHNVYWGHDPQLEFVTSAAEELFTVEEFQEKFGPKNRSFWSNPGVKADYGADEIDERRIEEQRRWQTFRGQRKGYVECYYIGDTLVHVYGTDANFGKPKVFWRRYAELKQSGANFLLVDRVEEFLFPTAAEGLAFAKYVVAKENPLWDKDLPYWHDTVDSVTLTGVPEPQCPAIDTISVILVHEQENIEKAPKPDPKSIDAFLENKRVERVARKFF